MTNQSTQSKQSQIFYAASAEYIEARHRLVIVFPELSVDEAPERSIDFYCFESASSDRIVHTLNIDGYSEHTIHDPYNTEQILVNDYGVSLRLATVASRLGCNTQGWFLGSYILMRPRLAGVSNCESIVYDGQPKTVPTIRFNIDKSTANALMHDWFFQTSLAYTNPHCNNYCSGDERRLLVLSYNNNRVDFFSRPEPVSQPSEDRLNGTADLIDIFADWPADEKNLARHMADHMRITSQL